MVAITSWIRFENLIGIRSLGCLKHFEQFHCSARARATDVRFDGCFILQQYEHPPARKGLDQGLAGWSQWRSGRRRLREMKRSIRFWGPCCRLENGPPPETAWLRIA